MKDYFLFLSRYHQNVSVANWLSRSDRVSDSAHVFKSVFIHNVITQQNLDYAEMRTVTAANT